ncbi:L-ornithine [Podosphaera aphanis]|nr:L-ornithine [Podosphaera aphanis]
MVPSVISTEDEVEFSSSTKLNGHMYGNGNCSSQSSEDLLDLICVGFGPASLAIAIALHDSCKLSSTNFLCLEKQSQFAWHTGMQLPGASMQISFLKDLATPRNPRSKFTFINYLFTKKRLNQFINLSTFNPSRLEFEDYLRWCASHFEAEGRVKYDMEVICVRAGSKDTDGKINSWEVIALDVNGCQVSKIARHVVIAVGGRPALPQELQGLKNVTHSSKFTSSIERIQEEGRKRRLRLAVVGNGQSAAEIFNDLWSRIPESNIKMVIKGASLRPSDDSPFVNEIFDPDHVDEIYSQNPETRAASIALDRGTNYGVVRIELLQHLYKRMYEQRVMTPSTEHWTRTIINNRVIVRAKQLSHGSGICLVLDDPLIPGNEEEYEVDHVFAATGYNCDQYEDILADVRPYLHVANEKKRTPWAVQRNYRLFMDHTKVHPNAGIWLQGCNEQTHGLSDTLLSILAIRGGELIDSIFTA